MFSIKKRTTLVYGLLSLVVLIWGFNFSFVKWALSKVGPLAFNGVRFTVATVLILIVLFFREGWEPTPVSDLLKMAGLGLVGHSLYQILFIKGLSLTTAGNSSLLIATSPIWTALLSVGLKKEDVNRKGWAGIVLAFAGVFLVTWGSGSKLTFGQSKTTGDLLTLAAALSLSAYTVLSKDLLERYSPLRLTALTMAAGAVGIWIYGGPSVVAQDWSALSATAWLVLLYSAVFAVVVGYLVWFTAVQAIGPTRSAIFNNMTPIISFTVAFILLGEPVSWLQIAGGVTVLLGIRLTVKS